MEATELLAIALFAIGVILIVLGFAFRRGRAATEPPQLEELDINDLRAPTGARRDSSATSSAGANVAAPAAADVARERADEAAGPPLPRRSDQSAPTATAGGSSTPGATDDPPIHVQDATGDGTFAEPKRVQLLRLFDPAQIGSGPVCFIVYGRAASDILSAIRTTLVEDGFAVSRGDEAMTASRRDLELTVTARQLADTLTTTADGSYQGDPSDSVLVEITPHDTDERPSGDEAADTSTELPTRSDRDD